MYNNLQSENNQTKPQKKEKKKRKLPKWTFPHLHTLFS